MNRKKVELRVLDISNGQAQAEAYAMVLGETNDPRQLPVIIGVVEAQPMMVETRGVTPFRLLTHTLSASALKALRTNLLYVLVYKVENGIFYSYLYVKAEEAILCIDARTSDAIALTLRMNIPIFVYDGILETECLKAGHNVIANENEDTNKEAASPKKTLEQLRATPQNAIDKEDYKRVTQLGDIINQQKKQ